ncbi:MULTISPECIES: hypothetical protein [Rhizobium]|nr:MULTISPECIES: hypothetical protein [Rhizobium]MDE8762010.1 hypothetical protein [Rhizobium sp. CBK13]
MPTLLNPCTCENRASTSSSARSTSAPISQSRRHLPWQEIGKYDETIGTWRGTPPQRAETDRDVAPKAHRSEREDEDDYDYVDEHSTTISSSRVAMVDPATNTYHRMESGLESDLVTILLARDDTRRIKAQDGPHPYVVEGKRHEHMIDVLWGADDGSITRFAVKPSGSTAERTRGEMQLLNNQLSKESRDRFILVTDEEITKGRVNLAQNILHTRKVLNDFDTERVHDALLEMGGHALVWQLAERLPDLYLSAVCTAVCDLVDKGLIIYDHPKPEDVVFSRASWVRVVNKGMKR